MLFRSRYKSASQCSPIIRLSAQSQPTTLSVQQFRHGANAEFLAPANRAVACPIHETFRRQRSSASGPSYRSINGEIHTFVHTHLPGGYRHYPARDHKTPRRSEEHTSELQSLMRISYAVFCLKTKKKTTIPHSTTTT